jgi:hypothetical protein
MGSDNAVAADLRPVQDRAANADQRVVADRTAMEHDLVTNRDPVTDDEFQPRVRVQDR